ncbi:concanavalin A-like lectin/glucanase [Durotheca rogersii]|uniref:concanavalin A-like lectin/glucanase n=1 Tax=Durotheca rogersii TaxID=419775 RepID=UPI00221F9CBD|nr:concanavalin A-like lectin/glucanase [Durotheca rogersii]KAI5867764.1 concanavalin A-like lectin/glucanase [Durotheca rogersii]
MKILKFVLTATWGLAAAAASSLGGRATSPGADKYFSPFLGGAVIDVQQEPPIVPTLPSPGGVGVTLGKPIEPQRPAIRTASARWNVPWMQVPRDVDLGDPKNRHVLAQWVGILGNACANASWYPFLQAGTATGMGEHGNATAYAWVEWFPAGMHPIPPENMTVVPGDQIRVAVDVYTRVTGHVSMQNLRTGQTYDIAMTADSPSEPSFQICLGHGTALFFQEWALFGDDHRYHHGPPVFENVTFADISAVDHRGHCFDLGADARDYWNMTVTADDGTAEDEGVAVPHQIDTKTFVIYSPTGKSWVPRQRYGPLPPAAGRGNSNNSSLGN